MASMLDSLGKIRRHLIIGELVLGSASVASLIATGIFGARDEYGQPTIPAVSLLVFSAGFCAAWFPLLFFNCFRPSRPISSRRALIFPYALLVGFISVCWLVLALSLLPAR